MIFGRQYNMIVARKHLYYWQADMYLHTIDKNNGLHLWLAMRLSFIEL